MFSNGLKRKSKVEQKLNSFLLFSRLVGFIAARSIVILYVIKIHGDNHTPTTHEGSANEYYRCRKFDLNGINEITTVHCQHICMSFTKKDIKYMQNPLDLSMFLQQKFVFHRIQWINDDKCSLSYTKWLWTSQIYVSLWVFCFQENSIKFVSLE